MGPAYDYDLICIGSGPAGQRAAVQAAKIGKRVAVIEKQRCIGGVCIETGTIPSKTFREAVRGFTSFHAYEIAENGTRTRPYMAHLLRRVSQVVQREADIVQDQLSRNDVELIRGHAAFTGPDTPHTLRIEAETGAHTLSAEFILLAVGTSPAEPTDVKPDGRTLILSDSILGLDKMPHTMAVVGGGVIGIEYASMFAALGVQVTIVDKRPRPLEFLDH